MGLFSFGNKNKQETVRDSGHFVKDDDAAYTERARSKRASHAGRGDPILPEKKRARRRLVGAIALALAAIVGLPMLLDSEPKPLATDIAISIPDKEKAAPLPVPSEQVAPSASVDSDEEIIEPPPEPAATRPSGAEAIAPAPVPSEPPPLRTLEESKPAATAQKPAPEPKPEPARKPEPEKKEEKKPVKAAEAHPKAEQVLDKPPRQDDSARAMAILEGKPAAAVASGPGPRYVVQVAALASQEKVKELQERLRAAGVASFTQRSGDLIRVRVGPFSKEEAEKMRAKLSGLGLSGSMVPQ